MANPYILPTLKQRRQRRHRGRIGAASEETTRTSSGIPIGAAVIVLLGVMVLSKGK